MTPWHRRRWAPWAVTVAQATAGAAGAGLAGVAWAWLTRPTVAVCRAGWPCATQIALAGVALATTYFVAATAVGLAIAVSEVAGPHPVRLRLLAAAALPPVLALSLTLAL